MIKNLNDFLKYRPIETGSFLWLGDNKTRVRRYAVPVSEFDFFKKELPNMNTVNPFSFKYSKFSFIIKLHDCWVYLHFYEDEDIDKIIKLNSIMSSLTFTGFLNDLEKEINIKYFQDNILDILFDKVKIIENKRKKEEELKESLLVKVKEFNRATYNRATYVDFYEKQQKDYEAIQEARTPWLKETIGSNNETMSEEIRHNDEINMFFDQITIAEKKHTIENQNKLNKKNNNGSPKNIHEVPSYTKLNKKKRGH